MERGRNFLLEKATRDLVRDALIEDVLVVVACLVLVFTFVGVTK